MQRPFPKLFPNLDLISGMSFVYRSVCVCLMNSFIVLLFRLRYVDVIQNLKSERTKQDEKYVDLRTKYDRLKGDFMYNIQLLQGRDAELVVNENAMRRKALSFISSYS